jgi:hypothetical protein
MSSSGNPRPPRCKNDAVDTSATACEPVAGQAERPQIERIEAGL